MRPEELNEQKLPNGEIEYSSENVLLKIWRKKKVHRKHSLVWRLRNRQIGNHKMPTSKFYQNLPLNETVAGVEIRTPELAHITIRRFSPDGNYLIAFNQVSVELFKFRGSHACTEVLDKLRSDSDMIFNKRKAGLLNQNEFKLSMKQVHQEIKTQIWSNAFQHQATIPIGLNDDEEMNRDFGVFINDYFICASTHRLDLSDLQMHEVLEHNECLGIGPSTHRGRPELLVFENFTFYSIDLKSKRIIDEVKFRVDRIQLQNNQGVSVLKDRLGIMHLHQQKISILKITPAGHFEPITTIGYVLRPNDLNLLLETHPEYRDADTQRSRYKLSVLNSFKQSVLSFFYRNLSHSLFYRYFKYFSSLKLWKILFVDESHLLIKMAREETVCDAEIRADAQRINQAASQPAFFILYNIELGKILSICENSSTNLCQVLINFQHFIEFSSHPEQPQGLPLCSIQSRAAKEKFRNQIQTAQYGTEIEAVKRIMWNLPPPAQGISPSPYLKQNLFSFDEKYIESVEKMKPVSENPIKFFCRCCDSLSFGIPLRTAWDQFSPVPNIKTANYIFHPNQPFALRLGRSENRHYNTGEMFPEIVTSFHFFNPNQPVNQ